MSTTFATEISFTIGGWGFIWSIYSGRVKQDVAPSPATAAAASRSGAAVSGQLRSQTMAALVEAAQPNIRLTLVQLG